MEVGGLGRCSGNSFVSGVHFQCYQSSRCRKRGEAELTTNWTVLLSVNTHLVSYSSMTKVSLNHFLFFYSLSEKRLKFDVSINLDLTVNFERNYTYTFDPSKSSGSEDDLVNIPNLPLIV